MLMMSTQHAWQPAAAGTAWKNDTSSPRSPPIPMPGTVEVEWNLADDSTVFRADTQGVWHRGCARQHTDHVVDIALTNRIGNGVPPRSLLDCDLARGEIDVPRHQHPGVGCIGRDDRSRLDGVLGDLHSEEVLRGPIAGRVRDALKLGRIVGLTGHALEPGES